jgi:hypothetical protein
LHSFFFWHTEGGMRPEMFTNTGCFEASCWIWVEPWLPAESKITDRPRMLKAAQAVCRYSLLL